MGLFNERRDVERERMVQECENTENRAQRLQRQGKTTEANKEWDKYNKLSKKLWG